MGTPSPYPCKGFHPLTLLRFAAVLSCDAYANFVRPRWDILEYSKTPVHLNRGLIFSNDIGNTLTNQQQIRRVLFNPRRNKRSMYQCKNRLRLHHAILRRHTKMHKKIHVHLLPVRINLFACCIHIFIEIHRFNSNHRHQHRRIMAAHHHTCCQSLCHMLKCFTCSTLCKHLGRNPVLHALITGFEHLLNQLNLATGKIIIKTALRYAAFAKQFAQPQAIIAFFCKKYFGLQQNHFLFIHNGIIFLQNPSVKPYGGTC